MTTANSLGFLSLSALMVTIPALAPGWFPATGFDGTSTRAIWMVLMGLVQGGIASTYLVTHWTGPVSQRFAEIRAQVRARAATAPQGVAQGTAA